MPRTFQLALGLLLATAAGCATQTVLPGTRVQDTPTNREIVETVEKYRQRLVARNIEGLLVLADERYFEDGGTPSASDDYGYEGLREVLMTRLQRLKNIRYEIQYRSIRIVGGKAEVDVLVDGSFEVSSQEVGDRYRRISDHHRFVLAQDDASKWKFISGM